MRPRTYYTKKDTDIFVYLAVVILLSIYAFYIKGTCEELGCLAAILPIMGIMAASVIEFFINVWAHSKKYHFNSVRKVIFAITAVITFFTVILLLLSVTT